MEKGDWFFCVYDFSSVESKIHNLPGEINVSLNVTPGVKIVPKREAVMLHKQIFDSWKVVASQPENKEWVNMVYNKMRKILETGKYSVTVKVDLMNGNGIAIKHYSQSFELEFNSFNHNKSWAFGNYRVRQREQVVMQRDYCDAVDFKRFWFDYIDARDITDSMLPVVSEVTLQYYERPGKTVHPPVLSVAEAEAFMK